MTEIPVLDPETDAPRLGASEPVTLRRFSNGNWHVVDGAAIREVPITVWVNRRELVTILCTPVRVNHLVLGFLANEGLIESIDEVMMMRVCDEDTTVDVRLARDLTPSWTPRTLTSGCGGAFTVADQARELAPVTHPINVHPQQVLDLMKQMSAGAVVYRQSGGVHCTALSDGKQILAVAEDVGRHSTVDKIRGQCMMEDIPTSGRILLTTGRLSTEMVVKAAKMSCPLIITRNSATARATALAEALQITLIGYARGGSVTVYSAPWRVAGSETAERDRD